MSHLAKQFEAKTSEREYVRLCGKCSSRVRTIEGNGASRKRPYANGCFADSERESQQLPITRWLERFGYVTLISAS
jgi:23S rRNA pseudouridine1911/1915/1917 synthase